MSDQITKSIIVKQDVETVYDIWSNFQYFPHFMDYIESVQKTGPDTSRWEVKGPLGTTVTWEAEMTRQEANKRIAWNSKDRSGTITTSGQVTFNALPENETEVTVILQYAPPGGMVGEAVANIFSNPEKRLAQDLQNFKRYVENGR